MDGGRRSGGQPSPDQSGAARPVPRGDPGRSVLVFDVNETLIDVDAMPPLFERVFGDLITYSMTLTLAKARPTRTTWWPRSSASRRPRA